jgi:hypothetical protein
MYNFTNGVFTSDNGYGVLLTGSPSGYQSTSVYLGADTHCAPGIRFMYNNSSNNVTSDLRGSDTSNLSFRHTTNGSTFSNMLTLANDTSVSNALRYGATVGGRMNASSYVVSGTDIRAPTSAGLYMSLDSSTVASFSVNKGTGSGGFSFSTYNSDGSLYKNNLNLDSTGLIQAPSYNVTTSLADTENVAIMGLDSNGNLIRNYMANQRFRVAEARLTAIENDLTINIPVKLNEIVTRIVNFNFFSSNVEYITPFVPAMSSANTSAVTVSVTVPVATVSMQIFSSLPLEQAQDPNGAFQQGLIATIAANLGIPTSNVRITSVTSTVSTRMIGRFGNAGQTILVPVFEIVSKLDSSGAVAVNASALADDLITAITTPGSSFTASLVTTLTVVNQQAGVPAPTVDTNASALQKTVVTKPISVEVPVAAVVASVPTNIVASLASVVGTASISFTGDSTAYLYTVQAISPSGIISTSFGSSSPVIVSGLTPGTSYTFTVSATNASGASAYSTASNAVVPTVAVTPLPVVIRPGPTPTPIAPTPTPTPIAPTPTPIPIPSDLYSFSSFTFTPMGAIARSGPTSITYNTTTFPWVSANLTLSGGIQRWTVPSTKTYYLIAAGAKGGNYISGGFTGSSGIIVSNSVSLTRGDVLYILVGQKGMNGGGPSASGGGGGGTFIVKYLGGTVTSASSYQILLIAGGGGGGGLTSSGTNALATTTANGGNGVPAATGGNGGGGPTGGEYRPGGGGFLTNGLQSSPVAGQPNQDAGGYSGLSFLNGGLGGNGNWNWNSGSPFHSFGGFGGGAGGGLNSDWGGGGGGGYSGGVSTGYRAGGNIGGGGGGSYDINGTNNNATSSGLNSADDGYAIISVTQPYMGSYLVVAGGGGGGYGQAAGGGAGGVLANSITLLGGTTYSVSVGAGGAGGLNSIGQRGQNGSDSVFGTLTATGGGGGGAGDVPGGSTANNGINGASGGGSATRTASAGCTVGTPGTGISGQGFSGGSGASDCHNYQAGGGGGGAGGVGGNASGGWNNNRGGNGGIGVITTIITTSIATSNSVGQVNSGSVYFGGGGGGWNNGSGGLGGGAAGTNHSTLNTPSSGSPNTGGGGSGGGYNGGSGGSGVVILSVPTISYSGIQSGAIVTSNGSNTVLIWKSGTGSYTA